MRRPLVTLLLVAGLFALPAIAPAQDSRSPAKQPTAVGTGGGAGTADPLAARAAGAAARARRGGGRGRGGGARTDRGGPPRGRAGRRRAVLVRHRRRRVHDDLL